MPLRSSTEVISLKSVIYYDWMHMRYRLAASQESRCTFCFHNQHSEDCSRWAQVERLNGCQMSEHLVASRVLLARLYGTSMQIKLIPITIRSSFPAYDIIALR